VGKQKKRGRPAAKNRCEAISTPDLTRDAHASFRWYAYQAYRTILAWLRCQDTDAILCEFLEDITTLQRNAAGQISAAELEQVKHQRWPLTPGQRFHIRGNTRMEGTGPARYSICCGSFR